MNFIRICIFLLSLAFLWIVGYHNSRTEFPLVIVFIISWLSMLIASYFTFKYGSLNSSTDDKKQYCLPSHGNEGEICKVWCNDENICLKGVIHKGKCDTRFKISIVPTILWCIGISMLCFGVILKYYKK